MGKIIDDKEKEVMLGVPEEEEAEKEIIELKDHRAMVCLPENAVAVTIQCRVYDPESQDLIRVSREMSIGDIREAFRKADDGYIDDDDRFTITDKGIAYLDEIAENRH
jgi:hypothetical protein